MTRDEAKEYLKEIASDLGFTGIEEYTCKHGVKMLEAIKVLEQKSCEDCVSRQAVLDINESYYGRMPYHINLQIEQEIKDLPSVTPQEQKTDAFDKIRAEIDQKQYDYMSDKEYDEGVRFGLMLAYQIIDKYKEG